MREILLARFGEIHLKGLNRPFFYKRLTENLRRALGPLAERVYLSDSRLYATGLADAAEAMGRAARVFGVHSVALAEETVKEFGAIAEACLARAARYSGSFRVSARRSDKRFPLDSMTIERELGALILKARPALRVDLTRPDHELCVEIRDRAYVYDRLEKAAGGLPTGTGGKATLLLSGGIDSPVAGYQLMRRGAILSAVHFYSYPFTGERAREKAVALARRLGEMQFGLRLHAVPLTEVQTEIKEKCPDELGTVLSRRFMMRIAERIARAEGSDALITGENLGQVASQTMPALACTDAAVGMPVFRPLIGLDKQEITDMAIRIGTYETSILPYEDCCAVLAPRRPATKPRLEACLRAEEALDAEGLIGRAIAGADATLCPEP